jgi:uncharacterized membrane protein YhaH (DUF805 family)
MSACRMELLSLFLSTGGRIARKPFAIAVIIVYVASFGARALLAAPVMAQAGIAPFVLVQALIIWTWYTLHAKRLRDAQRSIASAIGIAIVYAFAIALVAVIAALLVPTPAAAPDAPATSAGLGDLLLVLLLLALLSGQPHLGFFGYILMIAAVLVLAPLVTALVFSIWVGTRRTVEGTP